MTETGSQVLADVWRDHRQWSNAAGRLKRRIIFWRSAALAFAILGAVLATLATQAGQTSGLGRALSLTAALALAIVPVIRGARLGKDRIEGWTRARSVSEALKAETYLYLTRTPPYNKEGRDGELLKRTGRVMSQVKDLAGNTVGMPDADKPRPDVHDIARNRRLSRDASTRATAHVSVHIEQPHAHRCRLRRLSITVRSAGEPR